MVDLSEGGTPGACTTAMPRHDQLGPHQAIEAWRFWHVGRTGWPADALVAPIATLDLTRPGQSMTIFNEVTKARCVHHSHPAPHFACRCGIRGMYRLSELAALMLNMPVALVALAVVGKVRLFGRLEDEANGDDLPGTVRGQYAELVTSVPLRMSPVHEPAAAAAVASSYAASVIRGERQSDDPADCVRLWLEQLAQMPATPVPAA